MLAGRARLAVPAAAGAAVLATLVQERGDGREAEQRRQVTGGATGHVATRHRRSLLPIGRRGAGGRRQLLVDWLIERQEVRCIVELELVQSRRREFCGGAAAVLEARDLVGGSQGKKLRLIVDGPREAVLRGRRRVLVLVRRLGACAAAALAPDGRGEPGAVRLRVRVAGQHGRLLPRIHRAVDTVCDGTRSGFTVDGSGRLVLNDDGFAFHARSGLEVRSGRRWGREASAGGGEPLHTGTQVKVLIVRFPHDGRGLLVPVVQTLERIGDGGVGLEAQGGGR